MLTEVFCTLNQFDKYLVRYSGTTWQFCAEVEEWNAKHLTKAPEFEIVLAFEKGSRSRDYVLYFDNEDDALLFKMKWL